MLLPFFRSIYLLCLSLSLSLYFSPPLCFLSPGSPSFLPPWTSQPPFIPFTFPDIHTFSLSVSRRHDLWYLRSEAGGMFKPALEERLEEKNKIFRYEKRRRPCFYAHENISVEVKE